MNYFKFETQKILGKLGINLLLAVSFLFARAQSTAVPPTPVELMQGNQKIYSQLLVNRPLAQARPLSYFNVTTFSADNHNEISQNEFFSTSLLSIPVIGSINSAVGVNLNSVVGLNYFAGFQYSKVAGHWLVVFVPGIYFRKQGSFETLALVEFCPPLTGSLKLYTRVHTMYNVRPIDWRHNRSYHYLRIGLTVKRTSFGLGLNADWYGPDRMQEMNFGIFVRTELP